MKLSMPKSPPSLAAGEAERDVEYVIVILFLVVATPIVAAAKGRSVILWLLLGILLPLLSLILVAVLPSLKTQRVAAAPEPPRSDPHRGMQRIDPPEPKRVPCPVCAEMIMPDAKKCRFCGTEIAPPAPQVRKAAPRTSGFAKPIECPRCHKANEPDALDCVHCGQWLQSKKAV